jgi:Uma2 family endonuclease
MARELAKRWITADEYERMGEAGIFGKGARLELIEGAIYEMSPIGSPHAACVDALVFLLGRLAQHNFIIRVQSPIRLNDFSEPQPDIALLRWRDDFYRHAHPRPDDVLLVIEVADTTVETDRAIKLPLYAQAGVKEVWLINLPDERIELYAAPVGGTYQTSQQFQRGAIVQAQTIPNLSVNVSDILG